MTGLGLSAPVSLSFLKLLTDRCMTSCPLALCAAHTCPPHGLPSVVVPARLTLPLSVQLSRVKCSGLDKNSLCVINHAGHHPGSLPCCCLCPQLGGAVGLTEHWEPSRAPGRCPKEQRAPGPGTGKLFSDTLKWSPRLTSYLDLDLKKKKPGNSDHFVARCRCAQGPRFLAVLPSGFISWDTALP